VTAALQRAADIHNAHDKQSTEPAA
jgi:hypothetical protein